MTNQLYKTPASDLSVEYPITGSSIKGIIYGIVFKIIGSSLMGVIGALFYFIYFESQGMEPSDMINEVLKTDSFSSLRITFTVLGTIISVIAGYICARKSIYHTYRDTLIMGSTIVSISWLIGGLNELSLKNILLAAITIMNLGVRLALLR